MAKREFTDEERERGHRRRHEQSVAGWQEIVDYLALTGCSRMAAASALGVAKSTVGRAAKYFGVPGYPSPSAVDLVERDPNPSMSERDVIMQAQLADGRPRREIAREFGVTRRAVSRSKPGRGLWYETRIEGREDVAR